MPSILFVCTHNSSRSQMAEGVVRGRYGAQWQAASAGTEPTRVHPQAVEVMAEIGIDLSHHRSKTVDEVSDRQWDVVVTVCDSARESCPVVATRGRLLHHSFTDPSQVEDAAERLEAYRRVRDAIEEWLARLLPQLLAEGAPTAEVSAS